MHFHWDFGANLVDGARQKVSQNTIRQAWALARAARQLEIQNQERPPSEPHTYSILHTAPIAITNKGQARNRGPPHAHTQAPQPDHARMHARTYALIEARPDLTRDRLDVHGPFSLSPDSLTTTSGGSPGRY